MKTFAWLVRREFWEHRGGFLWTPIIVSTIFLALNLMAVITAEVRGMGHGIRIAFGSDQNAIDLMINNVQSGQLNQVGAALDIAMYSSTAIMSAVLGIVVLFYCLGSLYDDRRDRSILFWKSLPLSDTATVLSKVVSATVLAPLITFVAGVVSGVLMLLMYAIVLSLHGVSAWQLLMLAHPLRVAASLIGSIPLYLLWAMPTVGWLMLCSAWARSKPFLWALLLPVAAGIIVGWFSLMGSIGLSPKWYLTHVLGRMLLSVFPGGWFSATGHLDDGAQERGPAQILSLLDLRHSYNALSSANLWIGVAVGVVMIAAAVWLRRWRDES